MTQDLKKRALNGKTLRMTFKDGPTKGTTFDHSFKADGTVAWRDVSTGKGGEAKCGTVQIADDVFVMSYLSSASGFALTVVFNFKTQQMVGYASNDKQWFEQTGSFEVVKAT